MMVLRNCALFLVLIFGACGDDFLDDNMAETPTSLDEWDFLNARQNPTVFDANFEEALAGNLMEGDLDYSADAFRALINNFNSE